MHRLPTRLAIAAIVLAASLEAGDHTFRLLNQTGLLFEQLFVSPARAGLWRENVLGQDYLPEGGEAQVEVRRNEETCRWDLRAVDAAGVTYTWTNIDLCKITAVTLHYEKGRAWAEFQEGEKE